MDVCMYACMRGDWHTSSYNIIIYIEDIIFNFWKLVLINVVVFFCFFTNCTIIEKHEVE